MSTGNILGGIAGAVIGFFIGGPAGAFQGAVLGSGIGGALLPPPGPDGPRLEDLKVQLSTYGAPMPFEWGVNRHAGTIVWPQSLTAVEHAHEQSTKGGSSSNTFTYTVSCAVFVCEGPIAGIRRIWANKKIIYDVSAGNTGATQDPKIGSVRFYLGTESQAVDPLIEATDGASPAYLGYAYVVFENYEVTDLGGRPPQWEFEVISDGASGPRPPPVVLGVTETVPNFEAAIATVDPSTKWIWTVKQGFFVSTLNVTVVSDVGEQVIVSLAETDSSFGGFSPASVAYVGTNEVWVLCPTWPTPDRHALIARFTSGVANADGTALTAPAFIGWKRISDGPIDAQSMAYDPSDGKVWIAYAFTNAFDATLAAIDPVGITTFNTMPVGTAIGYPFDMCPGDPFLGVLGWGGPGGNPNFLIFDVGTYTLLHSMHLPSVYNQGKAVDFDPLRNRFIVLQSSGLAYYTIDAITGVYTAHTFAAAADADTVPPVSNAINSVSYSPLTDKLVFGATSSATLGTTLYILNADTLVVEHTYTYETGANFLLINPLLAPATDGNYLLSFDETHVKRLYLGGTLNPQQVALSTIVSDICVRAKLLTSDIDVTQLTDMVDGYIVPRQMTARAAIEPLQAAFYFDAVESDDKIKFVKRGAASVVTIPPAERAAHEFGQAMPDALSIVRAFELELPYQCDVEYPDVDADHLVGNQYDRRLTKESRQKINLQLPIVMTAAKAKEVARVTLYQAWLNQSYRWTTTRKYAKYEPTDVVTLPTDSATYTAVITSKKEQPNGVVEWEGLMTAMEVYVQSGADAAPTNYIPQAVFSPDVTALALLDIPLLRDEDDNAGFYVAMGGSGIKVPVVLVPLPIPAPPPPPAPGPTPTLYVATTGSDSNPGTLASPFLTIAHAASVAVPGDVISVASGTYTGNFTTSASGTAGHPVTYISAIKYGAKIVGTGTEIHWRDDGAYVDISGFDVSGSGRLGIYTTGDHATAHDCYVHDIMLTGGVTGNGGAGIVMFGAFSTAYKNKVVRIAAGITSVTVQGIYTLGASANIYNNIVGDISAFGIHQWHGGTTSTFTNNTVFNCGESGILIGAGDSGMLAGGSQHNFITNNIFANCAGSGIREYSYTGTGTSYNTYVDNITYNNAAGNVMTATGDVISNLFTANPLFVNYQADGSGNYHLQATSPAIGAGSATYAPSTDFDGVARPQGGTVDIGAYEYLP